MTMHRARPFVATLTLLATTATAPAQAGLLGQAVTGRFELLYPQSVSPNLFDPALAPVPAGFLNAASATVAVDDTLPEFGYDDGAIRLTADFNDRRLVVSYQMKDVLDTVFPLRLSFVGGHANLFADLALLSDGFTDGGLRVTRSGDTLTLDWSQMGASIGSEVRAVFEAGPARPLPTPAPVALMALGLLAARGLRRRA